GDVARAVAPARPDARLARQPRQYADPREGGHPGAAPLRGRGLLRQDAERPARGEPAPAEHGAGDRLALAADPDPRLLRVPPGATLSLVGALDRRGIGAVFHRGGALLRRVLPAEHLAGPRGPAPELPGVDPHPRLAREGGEALQPGPAGAGALPRALREVLRRGPLAGAAQEPGGRRPRAGLAGRLLRRLRVHGRASGARGDHARRSHPLSVRVPAGA